MSRRALGRVLCLALGGAAVVALVGCGTGATPSSDGRITVVTTTTVFADLVHQVGGDLVDVSSLVPRNGDVHTFEARPANVRAVASARLLVMNGLGLDDWLSRTIENAAAEGTPVIRLGEAVPAGERIAADSAEGTPSNPHLWLAIPYAKGYVDRIATALADVDPAHAATYAGSAAAYDARLDGLDASIRARFAGVPEAKRRIVTFHDALPYFAREYGLTIVGVAVASPGQDPSAAQIAALVAAIRAAGVTAIFAERQFPTRLVDQLAVEAGATVESSLYSDSVGDPPEDTYLGIMAWDADRIAQAIDR